MHTVDNEDFFESVKSEQGAWKPDRSGKYLTIVYKDVKAGDECGVLFNHPKVAAMSWSHALDDVDYLKKKLDRDES